MGTGIAIAALRGGVRVTIADAFPEAVEWVFVFACLPLS